MRTAATLATNSSSIVPACGQPARKIDSGASGQTATTSDCHRCSARNGVIGEITLTDWTRQVHSVRSAASSLFQNRRLERLMYQFDRSSR